MKEQGEIIFMPPSTATITKNKLTPEEQQFQSALEDLYPIAENLALHCESTQELIEVLKLALSPNGNGQLKLLLSQFELQNSKGK